MKSLLTSLFTVMILAGTSFAQQTNGKPSIKNVDVYYFHFTARCTTCKTIEAEAKKNVETLYPELVADGKISFTSLNLDEENGKSMGDKLGISGQTLLITDGNKKINITNEGFLYAVVKPEKFREIMKSNIDPMLK